MSLDVVALLQRAYAMEVEAAERYSGLTEQMRAVNNDAVATVFEKLAFVEGRHGAEIAEQLIAKGATPDPDTVYDWQSPEGPETAAFEDIHYLMTAEQALRLALHNERRAADYFADLCALDLDDETRALAEEFADEERAHVALVEDLLAKTAPTPTDWSDDPDPPAMQ